MKKKEEEERRKEGEERREILAEKERRRGRRDGEWRRVRTNGNMAALRRCTAARFHP